MNEHSGTTAGGNERDSHNLSDEAIQKIAQRVVDMLRAENWQASSHEAADRPMTPRQSNSRRLMLSDVRAAWMAFGKAKRIYETPRRDPVAGFAFLPDVRSLTRVMPSITPGNKTKD